MSYTWLANFLINLPIEESTSLPDGQVTGLVSSLIVLLLVATLVALATRWLRIPYVVGLVLAGLIIPKQALPTSIGLNADVILNLFLPILIFEAAINTDTSRLRSTIKPIALLAGPGVIFAAAITAILLKFGLGFVWITACTAGVILTITDTVSVIAAFRSVPAPSRLATIVEGESLFNDGIALVLLNITATVHLQGSLSLTEGVQQLIVAFFGGGILSLGLGYLCVGLFRQLDDALSNILLTVAVSLGTFQIGQTLGVSSAIAVVVAGLVIGQLAFRKTSGSIKVTLLNFWEYAGFGVDTFIFLLVGLEVDPPILLATIPAAFFAILAYQTGRILPVYPLLSFLSFFDRPLPLRWRHVLIIGSVKGSLSMALALSLPLSLPGRSELITLVFSTVLVSLIGQGLSLPWLVKQLKLTQPSSIRQQIEALQVHLIAAKAAQEELSTLLQTGSIPKFVYEELFASYQARVASSEEELRNLYNQRLIQPSDQHGDQGNWDSLYRRLFLAEKGAINDAVLKGLLPDEVAKTYLQRLDDQLLSLKDD